MTWKKKLKLVLLALLVLAVTAGGCYWFGYQWYVEGQWRGAAERIEANHANLDIVCFRYFDGQKWELVVDPTQREARVEKDTYTPYVLVGIALVDPDGQMEDGELLAVFNEILVEARKLAGKHVGVTLVTLIKVGDAYRANVAVQMHTARPVISFDDLNIWPLFGQPFPDELVLFPGR